MTEPENDRESYAFLCGTIKATWAIIDDGISGRKPFDFYPDAYRRFMDWLLRARDNIRSASVPGQAQRHINDLQFMLRDFFGDQGYACNLRTCFRWYRGGVHLEGPFEPEPDIDDIAQRFAAWNEASLKEDREKALAQRQQMLASLPPAVKRLPHAPDHHSMTLAYENAAEYRPNVPDPTEARYQDFLARYRADPTQASWEMSDKDSLHSIISGFNRHADQALIRGFVGYYLGNPLPEVRGDLWRACSLTAWEIQVGADAFNPWEINDPCLSGWLTNFF